MQLLLSKVPLDGQRILDQGGVVALVGPTGAGQDDYRSEVRGQVHAQQWTRQGRTH